MMALSERAQTIIGDAALLAYVLALTLILTYLADLTPLWDLIRAVIVVVGAVGGSLKLQSWLARRYGCGKTYDNFTKANPWWVTGLMLLLVIVLGRVDGISGMHF